MKNDEILYTGFTELDKLTGGFKRGELILIAGRPAIGKTSFALNIAKNVALRDKKSVAIFSLEITEQQLVKRMLCAEAEIDIKCIDSENMQIQEWQKLVGTVERLADARIYIDYDNDIRSGDIKEKYNILAKQESSLDLIIIDYLFDNNTKCHPAAIWVIFSRWQNRARELNIPIIILSQLSKSIGKRKDKRPLLTDLKIAKTRELPMDKILFIYRDDYYDVSIPEKTGTAEIIVAKNSNGKTGMVNLLFDRNDMNFKNVDGGVFVFDNISSINKNSFTAKLGNYWLESDLNGNLLYKIKCQNLRRISDTLLIAKVNNKEGLIDNDFNVISGFKYSDFKTLDKDYQYFKFRKNKKWGVIDRQGTIIIEPKYSKLERADKNFNYMFVKVNDKEYLIDRHENIIDAETEDKLICTPDFIENIDSINSNWRIVEINGKYGLVDKAFNQLKININNIAKILEKQINFQQK